MTNDEYIAMPWSKAFGIYDPNQLGLPWRDQEAAQRRNVEIAAERKREKIVS